MFAQSTTAIGGSAATTGRAAALQTRCLLKIFLSTYLLLTSRVSSKSLQADAAGKSMSEVLSNIERETGTSLQVASAKVPNNKDIVNMHQYDTVATLWEFEPADSREPQHQNWINSGKYQGDIAGIDPNDVAFYPNGIFRNAVKDRSFRWANGIVPYVIAPVFTDKEIAVIKGAMETYHRKSCVRFIPRAAELDYLNIFKNYGCYSLVGRTGGKQDLSLGRGCVFHEIIVHELMHTVGFWHEQSRPDRDEFVTVQWHNILPGMRNQFDKIDASFLDYLGESYDYYSIMHYEPKAFSRNGLPTIVAKQPQLTSVLGKARDFSEGDRRKIAKLYECQNRDSTPTPTTTTDRAFPTNPTADRLLPVVLPSSPPVNPLPTERTQSPPNPWPSLPPARLSTPPLPDIREPDAKLCNDRYLDCPFFLRYCQKESFQVVMRMYCPQTCGHCTKNEKSNPEMHPAGLYPAPAASFWQP